MLWEPVAPDPAICLERKHYLLLFRFREDSGGLSEHPGAVGAKFVANIVDGGDDQRVQGLKLGPALGGGDPGLR